MQRPIEIKKNSWMSVSKYSLSLYHWIGPSSWCSKWISTVRFITSRLKISIVSSDQIFSFSFCNGGYAYENISTMIEKKRVQFVWSTCDRLQAMACAGSSTNDFSIGKNSLNDLSSIFPKSMKTIFIWLCPSHIIKRARYHRSSSLNFATPKSPILRFSKGINWFDRSKSL